VDSREQKERDRRLVLYLLKCYPNCADEKHSDHAEFIDDMTDLLLCARNKAE
jgi:hypothetical protein